MSLRDDYYVICCGNCGSKTWVYGSCEEDIAEAIEAECCVMPQRYEKERTALDENDYVYMIEDALEAANWQTQSSYRARSSVV